MFQPRTQMMPEDANARKMPKVIDGRLGERLLLLLRNKTSIGLALRPAEMPMRFMITPGSSFIWESAGEDPLAEGPGREGTAERTAL